MATTVGMGAKKKTKKEDSKKVNELKAKIVELENENTNLIRIIEESKKEKLKLETKIAELEKSNS